MKKSLITAAFLCLAGVSSFPSYASDPCEITLCMFGKATGNSGGNECSSPEKDFFNVVKKKKGAFLPDHTADARQQLLEQCKGADPASIAQIIGKFGRIKG